MKKIDKTKLLEEAVQRLKALGMDSEVADRLREGVVGVCEPPFGAVKYLEAKELEQLRQIEEDYNLLIYIGIRNTMHDSGVMDSFLYVSGNRQEWKDERNALERMEPYAVVLGWEDRPEIGMIGIRKPSCNGLGREW